MIKNDNKNWYESELKSRQGKVILPANFGSDKYSVNKNWLSKIEPKLYVKYDNNYCFTITEILYSIFASQMGANVVCVKPMESVYVSGRVEEGVLVENFVTNKHTQKVVLAYEILWDLSQQQCKDNRPTIMCENSIANHLKGLQQYAKTLEGTSGKNVKIDPKTESKLFSILLIDFVLLNKDRHMRNISYILEEHADYYTITPSKIYDNSLCLGIEEYNKYKGIDSKKEIINDIKNDNKTMRFCTEKPESCYPPINEHAKQIAKFIVKKPEYYFLYKKATQFPFDKLKKLAAEQVPNYPVDEDFFKFAKKINNMMSRVLTKHVNLIMKQTKKETKVDEDLLGR